MASTFSRSIGSNGTLQLRRVDSREDYGELREQAIGFIGDSLHVLIFSEREDERGDLIWVISLRKAEAPEKRTYERATQGRGPQRT